MTQPTNPKTLRRMKSVIMDGLIKELTQRVIMGPVSVNKSEQVSSPTSNKPVFDKSEFSLDALFIPLTESMKSVLNKEPNTRTPSDLFTVRPIAEQLEESHLHFQYAKQALCQVMQLTRLSKGQNLLPAEGKQACFYFIVSGLVEVSDGKNAEEKRGHSKYFTYRLEPGNYIGLVSVDGRDKPMPEWILAVKPSSLVKVRRSDFDTAIECEKQKDLKAKFEFVKRSRLVGLSERDQQVISESMACEEFLSERVLLTQGHVPNHIFFVASGRCAVLRLLKIRGENMVIRCMEVSEGDFFGEENFLYKQPSRYTYLSIGVVKCFLLNCTDTGELPSLREQVLRSALLYPSDTEVAGRALDYCRWSDYKESVLSDAVNESSRSKYSRVYYSPSPSRRLPDIVPPGSKIDLQTRLSETEVRDPVSEAERQRKEFKRQPSLPAILQSTSGKRLQSKVPSDTRDAGEIVRDMEREHAEWSQRYAVTAREAEELKLRLVRMKRLQSLKLRARGDRVKTDKISLGHTVLPQIASETNLADHSHATSSSSSNNEQIERIDF